MIFLPRTASPRSRRFRKEWTGLISQWERGEKHPAGASFKLRTLVQEKGL